MKTRLTLLSFLLSLSLFAQLSDFPVGLNFTRATLFCDFAKLESDSDLSKKGKAPGFNLEIGQYYGGDDPAYDENFFRLGWFFSSQLGYGRMKDPDYPAERGSNWFPFTLDCGFVGKFRFSENIEAGWHYSFLGIYGHSTVALFGSACSARLRLWNAQVEYAREGDGVFRGCFVPRFNTHPIQSVSLIFLNKTHISAGVRYTTFDRSTKGETQNPYIMKEFRVFAGIFI